MPEPKDKRLRRLRELRRKALRVAKRARERRARRVLRRSRRRARWLLRKIRHRRKVLSAKSSKRKPGLVWYDGKQVASWIADELDRARANGWRGYVVSGYRTPAYSEQLCYGMCGHPRCPGMCAGRSSNHSQGYVFPRGAVDVTDYFKLAEVAARLGLRIKNRLPRDRVHFSSSGI